MLFWIFAIAVTAVASAALYYASLGRAVNVSTDGGDVTTALYKKQLKEIDTDIANERLTPTEAVAAKGELAREVLRLEKEHAATAPATASTDKRLLPIAILGVAVLALGTYASIGNPNLPSEPLASRAPAAATADINLDDAMARIEAQLAKTPDDLRGWTVIAPVYMEMGRYADAVKALRRVNELAPPTADSQTDLAEALMMEAKGNASGEPRQLLASAAKLDPKHVRSRFYLAEEAMRAAAYPAAVTAWTELMALGTPADSWYARAQSGLATAEAAVSGKPLPTPEEQTASQQEMIRGMVDGLSARLETDGGTVEEWTQLVRSLLVLNDTARAQTAYDKARIAYPSAMDRSDLDTMAASAGLKLAGTTP
jgi:cytochrome c-type biogenesis protein CcmH